MLAAGNSDLGLTGELLAETLVVDGTGNVDRELLTIRLEDRWIVGVKTLKT